jgi:hypothetical protein
LCQLVENTAGLCLVNLADGDPGVHDDKVSFRGIWDTRHVTDATYAAEFDLGTREQGIAIDPAYDASGNGETHLDQPPFEPKRVSPTAS